MRRVLRWVLRILGALVALAIVGVLAAVIALQTNWGRGLVKDRLETALNGILRGRVEVGRLEGGLLDHVVAHDVVVRDRSGREMIRVNRLEARYALLPLLRSTVNLSEVELDGVTVDVRRDSGGELNLTAILPPPAETPTPSPWKINVGRAVVRDAAIAVTLDGRETRVDGIEIDARIAQSEGKLSVSLTGARGRWANEDVVVSVRGGVDLEGTLLRVTDLIAEAGASRVAVARASLRTDGSDGSGSADVKLAAADVARFLPGAPWRADVTLAATFSHPKEWEVNATGTVAGAATTLSARIGTAPLAVEGTFKVDQIDPAAVWATAPPGMLRVEGSADVTVAGLEAMRGSAHLRGEGQIEGNRVDDLVADVTLDRGRVGARVEARGDNAKVLVDGGVDLTAHPFVIRETRVRATVTRISRFLGRSLPVSGDVDADLTFSGTLDDLAASGTVRGRGLQWKDIRVASLDAAITARRLPETLSGRVQATALDIRQGKTKLGEVRFDAHGDGRHIEVIAAAGRGDLPYGGTVRARVDRADDGTLTIEVPELVVRARQLEWKGHATRVTVAPDGGVTIAGASLRSRAGTIEASGQLSSHGGKMQVDLRDVQVDDVRRSLLPDGPILRGTASGRITAVRVGSRFHQIQAHVEGKGLAWGADGEPVSAIVDAGLVDRELKATIALDGGSSGTVKVDVDTRTPLDPFDVAAWRRFDQGDLRHLRVDLVDVSLARLSEVMPSDNPLAGTLSGTFDLGPGLATLDGNVSVTGVTTTLVDKPLAAQVKVDLRDGHLAVTGRVERPGGGTVDVSTRVAVPARIADWGRLDLEDLRDSKVTLDRMPLAALPALAERLPGLEGTVSGDLRFEGKDAIRAKLTVDKARAGQLTSPVDAEVDASLTADRLHVKLATKIGTARFVDAEVTLGAGLRALRRGDMNALRTAPVTGTARIEALPLSLVHDALKMTAPLEGKVDARVDLRGSVAAPDVRLDASLVDGRVGTVTFERLSATGALDARTLSGKIVAVERAGGSLEATIELDRSNARGGKAKIKAERFDLAFLAVLNTKSGLGVRKGVLDADLEVDGSFSQPAAHGSAKLTGGEFRVDEALDSFVAAKLDVELAAGGEVTVALRSGVGAHGKLTVDGKAKVEGLTLRESEGTFEADGVRVHAAGTLAEVSAGGKVTGKPEGELYALDVTLENGKVALPKDIRTDTLHETGLPADVVMVERGRPRAPPPAGTGPFLRLRVKTPGAIALRSESLRADLNADLDLTIGTDITIRGQMGIEAGYFDLFGRHWAFASSELVFGGENPINPRLSIHLGYEFQATTVYVVVTGTLKRPKLDLSSDSDQYDKSQLLGFVLGGSPDDVRPSPDVDLARDAMGTASGLVFGQLQPLINKIVPIDVVSVKQETTPTSEPSTLLSLGKWFTSDIYVAYRHRFTGETEQTENANEGLLEYFFWRRWRLDIIFGDRGDGSADVLWINRW